MHSILVAVGRRIGVPVRDARLLRLHSNAILALPSAGLLVRIATNPDALASVRAAVAVTRWLAARGFPCVVPADIDGQPLVERDRVVSIWHYVPTVPGPPATGSDLGRLLRVLHAQPLPSHPPGGLTDPFASVANAIEERPDAMSDAQRRWLRGRIAELREQWPALEGRHRGIHQRLRMGHPYLDRLGNDDCRPRGHRAERLHPHGCNQGFRPSGTRPTAGNPPMPRHCGPLGIPSARVTPISARRAARAG